MSTATGNARRADRNQLRRQVADLTAEVQRLTANAEAREKVMRREGDLLRAAQREADDLRAELATLRATCTHGIDLRNGSCPTCALAL